MIEISYGFVIFIYVFLRLKRDTMIVLSIGQEGTSVAKILSLVVLLGLSYVLQKWLKKITNKKTLWITTLIILIITCITIEFNFLPSEIVSQNSNILIKLLKNKSIILLYIISEIFAFMISSQFWGLINQKQNSKFNVFLVGQVGLLCSSVMFIFFNNINLWPIIIVCIILVIMSYYLFSNLDTKTINDQSKSIKKKNSFLLLIPITTILCGISAGLLDPFAKYQLSIFCNSKQDYAKWLSIVWICQSLLTIIFNLLLSKKTKFWFTSLVIIFGTTTIIIMTKFLPNYMIFSILLTVLGLKVFKYSSHSPLKEQYISTNDQLLFWDSLAGRFSKNIVAIILGILFIYGSNWSIIGNFIPFIVMFMGIIWFIISYNIEKNN